MRRTRHFPWLIMVILLFSLLITVNVPYTHDDWDWGRRVGISNWLHGTFNNRYVGTFFVLIMTRVPALKTLIMALTMTLLPLFCARAALPGETSAKNRVPLYLLACLIAFSMPAITWRQTYGWISAFANFTLAAFFLMVLLNLLRHWYDCPPEHPAAAGALCVLLGLTVQLFSENLSALLPVFLVCAIVLTRVWKRGSALVPFLAALVGTVLGAVIMFFNPLYQELAETGVAADVYRTLTFSPKDPLPQILSVLITQLAEVILPSLYESHPALVLALSLGVVTDLWKRSRVLALSFGLPMTLYSVLCFYTAEQIRMNFSWLPVWPELHTAGALAFSVLLFCGILCSPRPGKYRTLVFFLFGLGLSAPFAALDYLGPRCFHISHFCLLTAALTCYAEADLSAAAKGLLCTALILVVGYHIHVYGAIRECTALREELTREALQSQSTTLVLPSMDSRYVYSWGYNPQGVPWAAFYREFYGLPEDMELVFLPYGSIDLWPDIPAEMYEQAVVYP